MSATEHNRDMVGSKLVYIQKLIEFFRIEYNFTLCFCPFSIYFIRLVYIYTASYWHNWVRLWVFCEWKIDAIRNRCFKLFFMEKYCWGSFMFWTTTSWTCGVEKIWVELICSTSADFFYYNEILSRYDESEEHSAANFWSLL